MHINKHLRKTIRTSQHKKQYINTPHEICISQFCNSDFFYSTMIPSTHFHLSHFTGTEQTVVFCRWIGVYNSNKSTKECFYNVSKKMYNQHLSKCYGLYWAMPKSVFKTWHMNMPLCIFDFVSDFHINTPSIKTVNVETNSVLSPKTTWFYTRISLPKNTSWGAQSRRIKYTLTSHKHVSWKDTFKYIYDILNKVFYVRLEGPLSPFSNVQTFLMLPNIVRNRNKRSIWNRSGQVKNHKNIWKLSPKCIMNLGTGNCVIWCALWYFWSNFFLAF